MFAYRYNPDTKIYEVTQECQRDPIASEKAGEDIYLLPGDCTYTEPPEAKEGCNIVWNGEAWEYQEIPVEPEQEPYVPTLQDKINQLDGQYQRDKQELMRYYTEFMIAEDKEGMAEIKAELNGLDEQYDAALAELKAEKEAE